MENQESFNKNVSNKRSSQNNAVNSFGVSQSNNEANNIKSRLDESKARNLNNSYTPDANMNSNSGLPQNNSGLAKDTGSSGLTKNASKEGANKAGDTASKTTSATDKTGKGSTAKNLGGLAANTALGAAASKNETVAKTVNAVNKAKATAKVASTLTKIIKAIIAFFTSPFGWGALFIMFIITIIVFIVVIISVIISTISSFFGLTGQESYDNFNTRYEEGMTTESIEEIMKESDKVDFEGNCKVGFFASIRNFFGFYDPSNGCELSHYVKHILEEKENSSKIDKISPGYFMASLYYSFDTQRLKEDGTLYIKPSDYANSNNSDEISMMNDLDAITTLMAVNLYNTGTLDTLLNNYVLDNKNNYYEHVVETDSITGEVTKDTCEARSLKDKVSDMKLKLYLRYGQEVADAYNDDMSKVNAYSYTDSACKSSLGFDKPDVSKYDIKADPNTLDNDNAKISINGTTYGYNSGFIFTTYPRYIAKYNTNGEVIYNYEVDKEIEQIITNIESRQDYMNYVLGYPNTVKTTAINSGAVCKYNIDGVDISNLKVKLLHGSSQVDGINQYDPIEGEELVDFENYVLGVVYAEVGGFDDEVIKTQAIAARSYAIARAKAMPNLSLKQEGSDWILTIRNSNEDQTYCDPEKGCYTCDGYNTVFSAGSTPEGATCTLWKPALSKDSQIRKAVREVNGMFLVDSNNKSLHASYDSSVQTNWQSLATSGLDYVEILQKEYPDATLTTSECTYGVTGEWSEWKQGSPEWGDKLISTVTMYDSGCYITSHAMMLAASGEPLQIPNFNPGTFLDALKANGGVSGNLLKADESVRIALGHSNFTTKSINLSGDKASKASQVASLLNDGYQVILRVKAPPGEHYVYITGINGTDIYMADPATSSTATMVWDKYNNSGVIWAKGYKFN